MSTRLEIVRDMPVLFLPSSLAGPSGISWTPAADISTGLARYYEPSAVWSGTNGGTKFCGLLVSEPDAPDWVSGLVYFDGFRLPDYSVAYEVKATFASDARATFFAIFRCALDAPNYDNPEIRLNTVYPDGSDVDPDGRGSVARMQIGPDDLIDTSGTFFNPGAWQTSNDNSWNALAFVFDADACVTGISWRLL